jgi:hypothetical protein
MYVRYKIGGDLSLAQNYWGNVSLYFDNLANQVRSTPPQASREVAKAHLRSWLVGWGCR